MRPLSLPILILTWSLWAAPASSQGTPDLSQLRLPPGFTVNVFARVPEARSLAVASTLGAVFVGNRRGNTVYAAIDQDRDGQAERVVAVETQLNMPNGVAWRDGHLYIAENHRVFRLKMRSLADLRRRSRPEILFSGLPRKRHHGWRYLAFDGRGRLHITVGAACNICLPPGIEGTIIRLDPDHRMSVVAKGARNSVGLDFHPRTGDMYFTDNGADGMGDDSPPDELNHARGDGQHFGFPFFGGGEDRTPKFRRAVIPGTTVQPVVAFNAHVAALGVHFYRGTKFPAYRNDVFVAQHGSWNRSQPIGYRIMRIRMDADGRVLGQEPFAEGWLQRNGRVWGRPVDIKELADGSLLVSDDAGGIIYRISYSG